MTVHRSDLDQIRDVVRPMTPAEWARAVQLREMQRRELIGRFLAAGRQRAWMRAKARQRVVAGRYDPAVRRILTAFAGGLRSTNYTRAWLAGLGEVRRENGDRDGEANAALALVELGSGG